MLKKLAGLQVLKKKPSRGQHFLNGMGFKVRIHEYAFGWL